MRMSKVDCAKRHSPHPQAIVIGNFMRQLTFKILLHGEIVGSVLSIMIYIGNLFWTYLEHFSDKLSFELKTVFLLDNELNRYYRKIRTSVEIDPKIIHEELVAAFEPSAPSYTTVTRWVKHFHEGSEDVDDDP